MEEENVVATFYIDGHEGGVEVAGDELEFGEIIELYCSEVQDRDIDLDDLDDEEETELRLAATRWYLEDQGVTHVIDFETFGDEEEHTLEEALEEGIL